MWTSGANRSGNVYEEHTQHGLSGGGGEGHEWTGPPKNLLLGRAGVSPRGAGVARSLHSTRDHLSGSRFRAVRCYDDPTAAVVADLTCSEDRLSLIPGDAVGDCHARRLPGVEEAQCLQAEEDSGVKTEG